MAQYVFDFRTRVAIAPAIANTAAPTVAELNAGTRVDTFLAKDGLETPWNKNTVNFGRLSDQFTGKGVGTSDVDVKLTGFRDNTTDTLWNLIVYGTNAFLVVRYGILASTAWAIGQKVEVYPVEEHDPSTAPTQGDSPVTAVVTMAVTSAPNIKATVA